MMRLKLLLPEVEPTTYVEPTACPMPGCTGTRFHLRQHCVKRVRDTAVHQVTARRYECLRCGQTFRVYPVGISAQQTSARLKGIAVMVYLMGISYGGVALTLTALGWPLSKTAIYDAVQAAGERVPGLRREAIQVPPELPSSAAVGMDLTSVKCRGTWVSVGVGVDAVQGLTVTIDVLEGADAATLTPWVQEVASAVGAELLVTDDADGFKLAADAAGLKHQLCKSHSTRNTEALVEQLLPAMRQDADGSLAAIAVTPQQAVADLERLRVLVTRRQPEDAAEVEQLHRTYLAASAPKPGQPFSLAYRLRVLMLDRWNLWAALTRYRTWHGPRGERIDGTNNASERTIGWDIKERYRTMRGYKREQSILNVSRVIALATNHRTRRGLPLMTLVA